MSNLVKKTKPDRSKIDPENSREMKFWTRALDVSRDEILEAINKVGNAAAAVKKELANAKALQPADFPMKANGEQIKSQDGRPIAEAKDPAVAADVVERLNQDEARREEDKWSA
jgi:Protein of unknown function (DUF3606)